MTDRHRAVPERNRSKMNLYEAIFQRSSVRKFSMIPVEESVLSRIGNFFSQIEPLFPGVDAEIGIVENVEGKHLCHGLFGVTAPYYLTIYSEKRDKSEMNAGYLAEHLCLYMLTLGLGSCFLGSATLRGIPKVRMEPNVPSARRESSALYETAPASAAEGSQMPSGSRTTRESARRSPSRKELVIVIAFGIPAGRLTRRPEHAKRLPVRELCVYKDQPSRWMTQVIEAARLAPSAMNRQPWRFVVVNTRIHIFSKKDGMDKPRRWDEFSFGVMFAHIAIASEELWLDVDLIRLENISQKNFKSNQYVLSAIVRVPE